MTDAKKGESMTERKRRVHSANIADNTVMIDIDDAKAGYMARIRVALDQIYDNAGRARLCSVHAVGRAQMRTMLADAREGIEEVRYCLEDLEDLELIKEPEAAEE